MQLIALLLGSKVGRYLALGILVAGMTALVLWRVFSSGKKAVVVEQKIKQLEAVKIKVETDNEIASLPVDERRERLRRWVRDDTTG